MATTYQDAHDTTSQQDEASIDEVALSILDDLLSEHPTYSYDLERAGKYARQLTTLVGVRKNGLENFKNSLEALKKRPDSELASLLKKRNEANQKEQETQTDVVVVPELPTYARLPEECLPHHYQPSGPDDKRDWHDFWDDTQLRKVSPFLADYTHYSYSRSPEGYVDFHISGGLWTLSTVAARRVGVELSDIMYTPLGILYVARTSLFAKSSTAKPAIDLLKEAKLDWLLGDDETTPQKLLADMATGYIPDNYEALPDEEQEAIRSRIAMSGQVGWYYDEFNQLVDAMTRPGPMADFAGLLRKVDNCPERYKYSTRSHGRAIIEKPYLVLLASTTPANLREHACKGKTFWNDGFWARFAFITPPPKSFKTRTMKRGYIAVPKDLALTLSQWSKDLGTPECIIEQDDEGKLVAKRGELESTIIRTEDFQQDAYDAYVRYREALRELIATSDNQDLDGSYTRIADKAFRIAALLASLENKNVIDLAVWTLAQEIAEMFRRNLHEFYAQVNTGQAGENPLEEALIGFIKSRNDAAVTIRDVVRNGPSTLRKLHSKRIEELFKYLEKSGIVQCKKEGKKECYSLCG